MFDKLKQLAQAKGLSDEIKKEIVIVEKQGFRVAIRGDFSVEEIIINGDLPKIEQEKLLKEFFNEAVKELQMRLAKKMMGL